MANQFKFVGLDNNTTGGALTPFGSGKRSWCYCRKIKLNVSRRFKRGDRSI